MATYTKAELVKAIKAQCSECNDTEQWANPATDCTGKSCKLYPYQPGNGPGHAEKRTSGRRGNAGIAAIAEKRRMENRAK